MTVSCWLGFQEVGDLIGPELRKLTRTHAKTGGYITWLLIRKQKTSSQVPKNTPNHTLLFGRVRRPGYLTLHCILHLFEIPNTSPHDMTPNNLCWLTVGDLGRGSYCPKLGVQVSWGLVLGAAGIWIKAQDILPGPGAPRNPPGGAGKHCWCEGGLEQACCRRKENGWMEFVSVDSVTIRQPRI